jgi:alpha-tubulin suppressor-like RCC1 family protein
MTEAIRMRSIEARHRRSTIVPSWVARAALPLALSTAGCAAERTQIVVVVDTDLAVPSEFGAARIVVSDPRGGAPVVQPIVLAGRTSMRCEDSLGSARFCVPFSFLLVPSGSRASDAPVEVRVEAVRGPDPLTGQTTISRAARLRFSAGQTLRLPMFLARQCDGVVCPTDFTCAEGGRCIRIDDPPNVERIDPRTGQLIGPLPADASFPNDASEQDATTDAATDARALDAASDGGDVTVPDGSVPDASAPTCATGGCPAIAQLAAGDDFACARYVDGRVACWGANDRGQLGRGTLTPRAADGSGGEHAAAFVTGVTRAESLAVGARHACATVQSSPGRDVLGWGDNRDGALAVGSAAAVISVATRVVGITSSGPYTGLAVGLRSTYAAVQDTVLAWGDNADRALGTADTGGVVTAPSEVSDAMRFRSLIAHDRGACFADNRATRCVGVNAGGRFGPISAPGAIVTVMQPLDAAFALDGLVLGETFACGLSSNAARCWGEHRASGVLGHAPRAGEPSILATPSPVDLGAQPISELSAGGDFVLARTNAGALRCWGSNRDGECAQGELHADGTVTPTRTDPALLAFSSSIALVSAGRSFACAVDRSNVVWCWGSAANGQLGQRVSADPLARRSPRPSAALLPR